MKPTHKDGLKAQATLALYDEIRKLAFRIRDLEPWEYIEDSDVFAIRMNDGSEGYIAILGNSGQSYDIQFFDGVDSFQTYLLMIKGNDLPTFELMDGIHWTDYMSIMYEDESEIDVLPEEIKTIKKWAKDNHVNMHTKHGCPILQHFQPHYVPNTMENEPDNLLRFKEALEAVEWISKQLEEVDEVTELGFEEECDYPTEKGGKVVPLIVKTPNGYTVEKTQLPGKHTRYVTAELSEEELESLYYLPKSKAVYCRLIHYPGFVKQNKDSMNAFSPLVVLCVDKKTGQINPTEVCVISDHYELDVVRKFAQKLYYQDYLPQRIITDDARTEALLKDFCNRLGIILEFKQTRIPQLADACQYLYDNL